MFTNSIKIAGDNKTYSLTDEGYFYRTIEEKANLYVNDSARYFTLQSAGETMTATTLTAATSQGATSTVTAGTNSQ